MSNKQRPSNSAILFQHLLKKTWWLFLLLIGICLVPFFVSITSPWYRLLCLTVFMILAISVCKILTDYYSLVKRESGITWCQIAILIVVVLWLLGIVLLFNLQKNSRAFLSFGILSTMLGWVFQDTIKGIAAFLHLRLNHLLNIDDWIQVPKYNVDGKVKRITLTTVTVYNWDTTTSSIPICALHTDHFINLQNMASGKTHGRRVTKNYIFDTSCFHALSAEEAEQLAKIPELEHCLQKEEIHEGALNAQLYRLYLYHWLMNHPKISQLPALVVRWLEHQETGMSLQVYAFITEGSFSSFEWVLSQITEHIVKSTDWFGLRLYQSPSSHDFNNIRLTDKETGKEVAQ